jgi:hypothetical protein
MIDVTLQEVDLCQHLLVVEFLQFSERDERGGVRVGVGRGGESENRKRAAT